MKINAISKKISMAAMAAAMMAAPAVNVFAAPEDIIDTSKKGSITIHKYDFTAAEEDGVDMNQFASNGKKDTAAETTLKDYVIEGVKFRYAKVASINTETVAGKVKVMYDIPKELQTALGLSTTRADNKFTSDQINEALKNTLKSNTEGKNTLEDYIKTVNNAQDFAYTNNLGITSASNLDLGLYLIVETEVPANVHTTVDPFFVSLPMTDVEGEAWFYDVNVYPKNQTNIPDLDKLCRQNDDAKLYNRAEYLDMTTASEGDTVDYILVSHLPKITSQATYLTQYQFTDTLAKGLSYNKDAKIYFYTSEADARANNTAKAVETWSAGNQFTQTYNAQPEGAGQAVFDVTKAGLEEINTKHSEKWMVVSYSTLMKSDDNPNLGDKGNTNDVILRWRRTSMSHSDELEDRNRVFSYGLNIKKEFLVDSNSKTPDPTVVQFSLMNQTDGHYVVAKQLSAGSGIYYVTDFSKGTNESGNNGGTTFCPAADGTLVINGLEADTYVLTEMKTDKGFTLLKEPITIAIKCTEDEFTPSVTTLYDAKDIAANAGAHDHVVEVNGTRASATVDGNATEMSSDPYVADETDPAVQDKISTNARVKITVTNTPGFQPPKTGGAGTIAFTIAGCAAAFAGVTLVTKKSKKHEDNSEK